MSAEHRKHRRIGLDRRCWIVSPDGGASTECLIANVSETGAKILVEPDVALAGQFDLHLTHDGKVSFKSKLVWRNDDLVGVEFVDRHKSTGRS